MNTGDTATDGRIGDSSFNGKSIITFPADSLILKEGEVNLDMYKILKGNVELYTGYGTDKESLIGIIGPGAVFGEFGLLLEKPAIYTVIAYSDVYALRVTEGRIGDFIKENHSSVIQIMKNMANTMSIMQRQIMDLSEEVAALSKRADAKVEAKDLIREYSVYNPRNPHANANAKMHFLGRR
ncbi:MAG: Crp/Fnr family transcriptional regulator [Lachnospiraceae bacterium]|nr:Crp/Fnr family transcriptional regulator [Lachnospiraceae bacterium]